MNIKVLPYEDEELSFYDGKFVHYFDNISDFYKKFGDLKIEISELLYCSPKRLFINSREIILDHKIDKFITLNNQVFVLTRFSNNRRNVYAFDQKGNQIWQIEDSGFPYSNLLMKNGNVLVSESSGRYRPRIYRVLHSTGQIVLEKECHYK